MKSDMTKRAAQRRRKALSVRARLRASTTRPRLSVFRSLSNIYCQIIDDQQGRTLVSASSLDKSLRDGLQGLKKADIATRIGAEIASRAKAAGISKVAFDRGPYKYHGRIKALAEAARQGGLEF
jgi:large subunit ribosomal protein L18